MSNVPAPSPKGWLTRNACPDHKGLSDLDVVTKYEPLCPQCAKTIWEALVPEERKLLAQINGQYLVNMRSPELVWNLHNKLLVRVLHEHVGLSVHRSSAGTQVLVDALERNGLLQGRRREPIVPKHFPKPDSEFVRGVYAVLVTLSREQLQKWLELDGFDFGIHKFYDASNSFALITPMGEVQLFDDTPASWFLYNHRDEIIDFCKFPK